MEPLSICVISNIDDSVRPSSTSIVFVHQKNIHHSYQASARHPEDVGEAHMSRELHTDKILMYEPKIQQKRALKKIQQVNLSAYFQQRER